MHKLGLKTVFSKLFASVMLTLVLFAGAMLSLTYLVHDNSADTKWQVLAQQIVNQIDPFVDELDNAITMQQRLQARFMLAVIKKSFDIFDESLQAKLGLYDREGHLLIQTDNSDLPKTLPEDPSWLSKALPTLSSPAQRNVQAMGDRGYIVLYEPRNPPKTSELYAVLNLFTGTFALLFLMTIVLWWIARSMTWRLNRMSQQMLQLGEGDFSVRVPAKGTDEIATLAKGFNQAAQKIEQLIEANSLLLAHASHELRTPITRIRLQIEMMDMLADELPAAIQPKFQKRAQAIKQDLIGLNDLVESILLVSRLDAGHALEKMERIDLLKTVSQECQHYPEVTLYAQTMFIDGQPNLLVHLVRNLLNNALIHGQPPIEVYLYSAATENDILLQPDSLEVIASGSETMVQSPNCEKNGSAALTSANNARLIEKTDTKSTHTETISYDTKSTKLTNRSLTAPTIDSQHSEQDKENPQAVTATIKTTINKESNAKGVKPNDGVFSKHLRRVKPKTPTQPKFAVLTVIDQGSGIPLDKRLEIFSPFVRLQQKNKGSGLGLSLVAQIVEAHHGRIFTDVYNGHTRFVVVLPTTFKPSMNVASSKR